MTKDKALRLALEALEEIGLKWPNVLEAIDAIRLAIDVENMASKSTYKEQLETKDEPFEYWNAVEGWVKIDEVREHFESASCGTIYKNGGEGRVPLYTTPQRTWVGLTQGEFEKLINDAGFTRSDLLMMGACIEQIVDLVEAKLKERNT
jgi:hypothetical protein